MMIGMGYQGERREGRGVIMIVKRKIKAERNWVISSDKEINKEGRNEETEQ